MCHTEKDVLSKIAILGSGTGTNARAILEAADRGVLRAEVCLIVSDNGDAGILDIAKLFRVRSRILDPGKGRGGQLSDEAIRQLCDWLAEAQIELVVLAGFMRIIREPLLSRFPNRILNIHPSLLPKYPGLNTVDRAIDGGENETGCTIHLVDAGVDTGRVLHQEKVPILEGDTVEEVTAKIHRAEHKAYPMVIQEFIENLCSEDGAAKGIRA